MSYSMPIGLTKQRFKGMTPAVRNGRMGMRPASRSADAVERAAMATARIEEGTPSRLKVLPKAGVPER
jgi:hypothetical protein